MTCPYTYIKVNETEEMKMQEIKQEIERLEDELLEGERGYTAGIEVAPAGSDGNIEWNAAVVEIVKIDDDTIAYRYSDDSIDTDWTLGTVADAVNEATETRGDQESATAR